MNRRIAIAALLLAAACAPRTDRTKPATPVATATPSPIPVTMEPAPQGLARPEPKIAVIAWAGQGAGALLDVSAIGPGEAIAVGEPGVVRIRGDLVEVAPLPDGIPTSVWTDGPGFAVVVGYGGLSYVRENGGAWTAVATGTDADLLAVWGRSKDGVREVYAAGARGTLLRLAGSAWEKIGSPESAHLFSISGNAARVWALGESGGGGAPGEGAILRSAGGAFSDACPDLACGGAVYDGWAPVPNELWTAGARGEVVRYAGAQAEWITTGAKEDLTGIWGTGTRDLFVIGDAGTCLHFDGTTWKPLDAGERDLRSIAGLPSGEAWLVGADGAIRHLSP